MSRRLARHLAAYRHAHLPLAPLERRFRAILGFLEGRRTFTDDDILGFWRGQMREGERPGFRTVAEHFVTFEAASTLLGGLAALASPASLDAVEGWEERLDASLADLAGAEPAETLAALLAALPDGPKILTGAERDDLAEFLRLEPFHHRTRPLTTLRAASFGRVQSGLANRLRRRARRGRESPSARPAPRPRPTRRWPSGLGADRSSRPDAADRGGAAGPGGGRGPVPRGRDALAAARADIRRIRRAGFDDPDRLAAGFAAADAALLRLAEEAGRLARAIAGLARQRPLEVAFATDRDVFADAFAEAYAAEATA